jgi:hypothetical protein
MVGRTTQDLMSDTRIHPRHLRVPLPTKDATLHCRPAMRFEMVGRCNRDMISDTRMHPRHQSANSVVNRRNFALLRINE